MDTSFYMKHLFKFALLHGNMWAVTTQLQQGILINTPDSNGDSPLMIAMSRGHLDLCRLLLEKGADIHQENSKGETVLFVAETKGFNEIVDLFKLYVSISDQEIKQNLLCFEDLFVGGEWEAEETIAHPLEQDLSVLEYIQERERGFFQFVPVEDGEDWTDIDIELPLEQVVLKNRIRLTGEYIEKIQIIISRARQQSSINRSYLEDVFEDHTAKAYIVRRLCETLSAYDILIIDESPYLFDVQFRGFDSPSAEIVEDFINDEIFHEFMLAFKDDGEVIFSYIKDLQSIHLPQQDANSELLEKRDKATWELLHLLSNCPKYIVDLDNQCSFLTYSFDKNGDQELTSDEFDENSYLPIDSNFKKLYTNLQQEKSLLAEDFTPQGLFDILGIIQYEIDFIQRCSFHLLSILSANKKDISFEITQWENKTKFYYDSLVENRNLIVTANLRLAFHFAQKYQRLGCELADIVQEANIGLLRATSKFDSTKGAKFSTYAVWWIRQAIMRFIQNTFNTIRIPCHVLANAYDRFGQDAHGWELFIELSINNEEIPLWLNRCTIMSERDRELPLVKVRFDFFSEKEQNDYFIENKKSEISPEDAVLGKDMNKHMLFLLDELPAKPREILMLRFGFQCYEHTLEEIGLQFGVTRERIRQIEKKALIKLGHQSRLHILNTFC